MSALREIFAKFDIDASGATAKLKSLNDSVGGVKAAFATMASAVVGAFSVHALTGFIEKQIELGSQVNDTAEKLGVSVGALQQFQFAAGLSGISAEQAGEALKFLNKGLGEAIGGSSDAAKTFAGLGIDLGSVKDGSKSAADLLPDLADKFAGLGSDAERTNLAMKLFGRSGASMLPLLKQGSGELHKLSEEFQALGGGMNEEFIKAADKAGDEVDKLKFAFSGLKSRISIAILPAVTEFAMKLQRVVVSLQGFAKQTYIVQELLAGLGVVAALSAGKAALHWGKFFGIFPAGKMGIAQTLGSLGKFGLYGAAVAGLGLVFEDLWVGMKGGNSLIREWLNNANGVENTDALFANLNSTVDQIGAVFVSMRPAIMSIVDTLAKMLVSPYFIAGLEFVIRLIGAIVSGIVNAARMFGNLALAAASAAKGNFKEAGQHASDAGKAADEGGAAIFGKNGFFGDAAYEVKPSARPGAAPMISDPSNDPSSPYYYKRAGDGGPANVTNSNQITVNLNGASDANTARDVGRVVKEELAAAQRNTANTFRRGP